jgi:hypothetical protein
MAENNEIWPISHVIGQKILKNGRICDKNGRYQGKLGKCMSSQDKKLTVLHQLSQESEPISLGKKIGRHLLKTCSRTLKK